MRPPTTARTRPPLLRPAETSRYTISEQLATAVALDAAPDACKTYFERNEAMLQCVLKRAQAKDALAIVNSEHYTSEGERMGIFFGVRARPSVDKGSHGMNALGAPPELLLEPPELLI